MENLPFLFLKELFSQMPGLNEAIRCSHVCKNWRAAYEALIKPETLCLYFEKSNRQIPLNHRLFYTNDPVAKLCFLKIAFPSNELQFFHSAASTHFSNIKKLVIFSPLSPLSDYDYDHLREPLKINFQSKLNHFKALEYCEIHCQIVVPEDCELDLPNLKVLCVDWCSFEKEKARITLNTPSLKAMKITGDRHCRHQKKANITNFKFLFPSALRHLEMIIYESNFKFDTQFENLEILVIAEKGYNVFVNGPNLLLADDFLESLPSLKFIFLVWYYGNDLRKLEAGKRKFNLKDLKIFNSETGRTERFDYPNWRWYLEHREQLRYWPGEFDLVFNKLINCQVPLDLFRTSYFRIKQMKVRQVDDQSLLVDFLRNVRVTELELEYDCNLGQSFIDQIADSAIILNRLTFDECVWNRMNDFSGLTRLNTFHFEVYFQQFQREAALAVLRNPLCATFFFYFYEGFSSKMIKYADGELRKRPNFWFGHYMNKVGNDFVCRTCGWTSSNDPNRFEDPVAVTVQHAGNGPTARNMT